MAPQTQQESDFGTYRQITRRLRDRMEDGRPVVPPIEGNLFHYTTAAGLIGIISSAELWATSCEYLNDPEEVRYGARLAAEALRLAGDRTSGPVAAAVHDLGAWLTSESVGSGYFVTCFCDKGDLLSQWRSYADRGGGYCLEFAREDIQRWADSKDAALFQVLYDSETQVALLEEHVRWALSKLQEDLKADRDPENTWKNAAQAQLRRVVLPLVFRFKHPAFEGEGERRLGYFLGSGLAGDYPKLQYRPGHGFVIPYLPLSFSSKSAGAGHSNDYRPVDRALPLVSVRCGPTTHPDLGKSGVEMLLQSYEYRDRHLHIPDSDVRVEVSAVPYRD